MRILAIASGGGHWEQLLLLRGAFDGARVTYVTTIPGLPERAGLNDYFIVPDCNRNDYWAILVTAARFLFIIYKSRPDFIISTGALPGLIGIVLGKVFYRKHTIWVDSVANGQELSLSGKSAKKFSDLWLTQWEEVASKTGAKFLGRLI